MDTGSSEVVTDRGSGLDLKAHQSWSGGAGTADSSHSTDNIQTVDVVEEGASDRALPLYTLDDVREHWEAKSCWIVLYDFVYDVTAFLQEHPGGAEILLEHAGHDSTVAFKGKGHSEKAHSMLKKYCIGQLISSERIY